MTTYRLHIPAEERHLLESQNCLLYTGVSLIIVQSEYLS